MPLRSAEDEYGTQLDNRGAGRAILTSLSKHASLAAFLQPTFDPAAFAAQVVIADSSNPTPGSKSRAEMVVSEINEQLGRVEEAIQKHIVQHQKTLMQSMGDLGELKENCNVLTIRSKELRRSVEKLNNELLEPYQTTELRTSQLRRVHEANDLLKRIARFSYTLTRLRKSGLTGPTAVKSLDLRELAKAATNLYEVEALYKDPQLGNISLVVADKNYVTSLGRALRQTAKDSLKVALKTMNQADLGSALQVFYNLQSLAFTVLESLALIVAEATEATRRAFDPQNLERVVNADAGYEGSEGVSSPPGVSSTVTGGGRGVTEMETVAIRQRRARFRDHCEKWANAIYDCAIKVWHLQRVLQKKVDATTNERFLDVILQSEEFQARLAAASNSSSNGNSNSNNKPRSSPVGSLYWMFWMDLTSSIRKIAEAASRRTSSNRVIKCYPYFFLTLVGMLNRLLDNTSKHKAGGLRLPTGQQASGQQGNAIALRALMEALGASGGGGEGGEGGDQQHEMMTMKEPLAEIGGTVEERDALLDSLSSLRDLYLEESLQRLCRPVEQMFPQIDGYQAAIPSKHDIQSFFKVMQTELMSGLAEGGPLLLPHLVRGVVKAVKLFCTKVESLMNTSEGSRKLYALRGYMLGPEKEHNLLLLQLLAFLHTALRRLPKDLSSAALDFMGAVGAGSLGDSEIESACQALQDLAVLGVIRPYMVDIADELGGIMAEMHLENYAPKGEDEQGPEDCSRFLNSLQNAITAIRKHHLNRFPQNSDFVIRGFKWLAGRLLRLYVSHAALIRPLNEKGKAKLMRDTAMIESTLSTIAKVSELGSSYQELRAFRELCFYGDEQNPITVSFVMKESFIVPLRPSTLLNSLFTRAPLELSSPHVIQRCSERTLVEELLAMYFNDVKAGQEEAGGREKGGDVGREDPRVTAETAHWQVVQVCLDAYAQRMSASQADVAYIYDVMLNLGGLLLKVFREKVKEKGGEMEGGGSHLPLNW